MKLNEQCLDINDVPDGKIAVALEAANASLISIGRAYCAFGSSACADRQCLPSISWQEETRREIDSAEIDDPQQPNQKLKLCFLKDHAQREDIVLLQPTGVGQDPDPEREARRRLHKKTNSVEKIAACALLPSTNRRD
jgi:hypothetical protein